MRGHVAFWWSPPDTSRPPPDGFLLRRFTARAFAPKQPCFRHTLPQEDRCKSTANAARGSESPRLPGSLLALAACNVNRRCSRAAPPPAKAAFPHDLFHSVSADVLRHVLRKGAAGLRRTGLKLVGRGKSSSSGKAAWHRGQVAAGACSSSSGMPWCRRRAQFQWARRSPRAVAWSGSARCSPCGRRGRRVSSAADTPSGSAPHGGRRPAGRRRLAGGGAGNTARPAAPDSRP